MKLLFEILEDDIIITSSADKVWNVTKKTESGESRQTVRKVSKNIDEIKTNTRDVNKDARFLLDMVDNFTTKMTVWEIDSYKAKNIAYWNSYTKSDTEKTAQQKDFKIRVDTITSTQGIYLESWTNMEQVWAKVISTVLNKLNYFNIDGSRLKVTNEWTNDLIFALWIFQYSCGSYSDLARQLYHSRRSNKAKRFTIDGIAWPATMQALLDADPCIYNPTDIPLLSMKEDKIDLAALRASITNPASWSTDKVLTDKQTLETYMSKVSLDWHYSYFLPNDKNLVLQLNNANTGPALDWVEYTVKVWNSDPRRINLGDKVTDDIIWWAAWDLTVVVTAKYKGETKILTNNLTIKNTTEKTQLNGSVEFKPLTPWASVASITEKVDAKYKVDLKLDNPEDQVVYTMNYSLVWPNISETVAWIPVSEGIILNSKDLEKGAYTITTTVKGENRLPLTKTITFSVAQAAEKPKDALIWKLELSPSSGFKAGEDKPYTVVTSIDNKQNGINYSYSYVLLDSNGTPISMPSLSNGSLNTGTLKPGAHKLITTMNWSDGSKWSTSMEFNVEDKTLELSEVVIQPNETIVAGVDQQYEIQATPKNPKTNVSYGSTYTLLDASRNSVNMPDLTKGAFNSKLLKPWTYNLSIAITWSDGSSWTATKTIQVLDKPKDPETELDKEALSWIDGVEWMGYTPGDNTFSYKGQALVRKDGTTNKAAVLVRKEEVDQKEQERLALNREQAEKAFITQAFTFTWGLEQVNIIKLPSLDTYKLNIVKGGDLMGNLIFIVKSTPGANSTQYSIAKDQIQASPEFTANCTFSYSWTVKSGEIGKITISPKATITPLQQTVEPPRAQEQQIPLTIETQPNILYAPNSWKKKVMFGVNEVQLAIDKSGTISLSWKNAADTYSLTENIPTWDANTVTYVVRESRTSNPDPSFYALSLWKWREPIATKIKTLKITTISEKVDVVQWIKNMLSEPITPPSKEEESAQRYEKKIELLASRLRAKATQDKLGLANTTQLINYFNDLLLSAWKTDIAQVITPENAEGIFTQALSNMSWTWISFVADPFTFAQWKTNLILRDFLSAANKAETPDPRIRVITAPAEVVIPLPPVSTAQKIVTVRPQQETGSIELRRNNTTLDYANRILALRTNPDMTDAEKLSQFLTETYFRSKPYAEIQTRLANLKSDEPAIKPGGGQITLNWVAQTKSTLEIRNIKPFIEANYSNWVSHSKDKEEDKKAWLDSRFWTPSTN